MAKLRQVVPFRRCKLLRGSWTREPSPKKISRSSCHANFIRGSTFKERRAPARRPLFPLIAPLSLIACVHDARGKQKYIVCESVSHLERVKRRKPLFNAQLPCIILGARAFHRPTYKGVEIIIKTVAPAPRSKGTDIIENLARISPFPLLIRLQRSRSNPRSLEKPTF